MGLLLYYKTQRFTIFHRILKYRVTNQSNKPVKSQKKLDSILIQCYILVSHRENCKCDKSLILSAVIGV